MKIPDCVDLLFPYQLGHDVDVAGSGKGFPYHVHTFFIMQLDHQALHELARLYHVRHKVVTEVINPERVCHDGNQLLLEALEGTGSEQFFSYAWHDW